MGARHVHNCCTPLTLWKMCDYVNSAFIYWSYSHCGMEESESALAAHSQTTTKQTNRKIKYTRRKIRVRKIDTTTMTSIRWFIVDYGLIDFNFICLPWTQQFTMHPVTTQAAFMVATMCVAAIHSFVGTWIAVKSRSCMRKPTRTSAHSTRSKTIWCSHNIYHSMCIWWMSSIECWWIMCRRVRMSFIRRCVCRRHAHATICGKWCHMRRCRICETIRLYVAQSCLRLRCCANNTNSMPMVSSSFSCEYKYHMRVCVGSLVVNVLFLSRRLITTMLVSLLLIGTTFDNCTTFDVKVNLLQVKQQRKFK